MAHSKSALKRIRQGERHAEANKPYRTRAARSVRDALNAGNLQQVKSTALKVQTDVADVKSAAQALESAAK